MAAWLTGLSARDSALLFSHVMGFIKNVDEDIDYFRLEVALDYYGRTSCSHELEQVDDKTSIVGYRIGDCFQVIFKTTYEENGFGRYPKADLNISVVDERDFKNPNVFSLGTDIKYKAGRKYRCNALGGVTLSSDQVSYIITTLSRLKEIFDEWNHFLESF